MPGLVFRNDKAGKELAVVVHAINPTQRQVGLSSRPAWLTVPGPPGLHRETLTDFKTKQAGREVNGLVAAFRYGKTYGGR